MGQPPDDMLPPPPPQAPGEGTPGGAPAPVSRSSADGSMLLLGGLMLIASFLSWYRVKLTIPGLAKNSAGANAWDLGFLLGWLPVLLALVAAMFAGMRMFGPQVKVGPYKVEITPGSLYLICGVGAFVLTVLRFLVRPGGVSNYEILSGGAIRVSRGLGLYLAIIITLGMLVVGLRAYQAEQRR